MIPWWMQLFAFTGVAFIAGLRLGVWYARGEHTPGVVTGDDARRLEAEMRRNSHRGCLLCDGSGYKKIMVGWETRILPCTGPLLTGGERSDD